MDNNKVGEFIAKCRKEKQMTQAELAEKLGITDRSVSKWERGINLPDTTIMAELCEVLGITINDLFNGDYVDVKKENNNKKVFIILICLLVFLLALSGSFVVHLLSKADNNNSLNNIKEEVKENIKNEESNKNEAISDDEELVKEEVVVPEKENEKKETSSSSGKNNKNEANKNYDSFNDPNHPIEVENRENLAKNLYGYNCINYEDLVVEGVYIGTLYLKTYASFKPSLIHELIYTFIFELSIELTEEELNEFAISIYEEMGVIEGFTSSWYIKDGMLHIKYYATRASLEKTYPDSFIGEHDDLAELGINGFCGGQFNPSSDCEYFFIEG